MLYTGLDIDKKTIYGTIYWIVLKSSKTVNNHNTNYTLDSKSPVHLGHSYTNSYNNTGHTGHSCVRYLNDKL